MNRLSDALHAAASPSGGAADELDLDRVHQRVGLRRRRRARARLAGGVVGAVALVAGLAVAVGAGGSPDGEVRAQAPEDPTVPETSEPTTSLPQTSTTVPGTSTTVPGTSTTTSLPGTSTTSTEPPPTSTTEPPPTTTTPPSPVEMTWSYAGLEQYRLFQPQCSDLTHWLDADAVGSDGSVWVMREDYCGTHHGDRWEGEGTFSLAAPDGSSLSGRMTSAAPMPTDGVPYSWTVEEGTGSLAGATGGCVVTILMTDQAFGRAHHEGTITCDLTLGGSDATTPSAVIP